MSSSNDEAEAPQVNADVAPEATARGSALEVLMVSSKLGLTSFGGPVAHLGYFHTEYVEKRKWLDEQAYGELCSTRRALKPKYGWSTTTVITCTPAGKPIDFLPIH